MFDRVAGVYDLLNSVMTAGMHHRWRERAGDAADLGPGDTALDVCCGTGDLTFELARRVGPDGHVIGSDFSERMLDLAREKAAKQKIPPTPPNSPGTAPASNVAGQPTEADAKRSIPSAGIRFEWGDALELPYDDASFDAVTVGFGVRNLADLDRGISEMARVLKPGGRLVILEITVPRRKPLSTFFSIWFDRIVPLLGRFAGDPDAYSYLPESVKRFPAPEKLAEMLDRAGLTGIRWSILAGGIIAIHAGRRVGGSDSPGLQPADA